MRWTEDVERTILCLNADDKAGQRKVVSEQREQLELKTFSPARKEAINICLMRNWHEVCFIFLRGWILIMLVVLRRLYSKENGVITSINQLINWLHRGWRTTEGHLTSDFQSFWCPFQTTGLVLNSHSACMMWWCDQWYVPFIQTNWTLVILLHQCHHGANTLMCIILWFMTKHVQ